LHPAEDGRAQESVKAAAFGREKFGSLQVE